MSALYSQAFDHMSSPHHEENDSDYTYQDPEVATKIASFRRSTGEGRFSAFRVKQSGQAGRRRNSYDEIEMGQDHSTPHYIDVFDDNTNVRNISVQQRGTLPVTTGIHTGHSNEESEDYCYAVSRDVAPPDNVDGIMRHGPAQSEVVRTVSLKDDYSHPHDRLSIASTTKDYIEPYQSKGGKNPVSPEVPQPDPGGFYALAKDVDEIRQSGPPTQDRNSILSDHYNHLSEALQQVSVARPDNDRYDHFDTWSSGAKKLNSIDSANEHFVSAESSPRRKCSNVSDDVFDASAPVNKVTPTMYRDLPANYEEPWDTEEKQKKFDLLVNKAGKTHEKRLSVDKQTNSAQKSAGNVENKGACDRKETKQVPPQTVASGAAIYETSWGNSVNQRKTSETTTNSRQFVQPKPHVTPIPGNYEDAWDLPEKQREFEEKLLQARKQRASQGQIRDDDPAQDGARRDSRLASVTSTTSQKVGPVIRSDSCRSLGALAEKIDVSLPLEKQSFYHGAIKRSAAERILLVFKEGSYLIRRSETCKTDFSLTLKGWTGQPMHMKIACRPDGTYVLGENSPPFATIPEMVDYYTMHELPVQNAERICLLYPIPC